MVDGVIKDYQGLQQEIDNLIEKKKAEATLNAYLESYTEAIVEQKEAREALFDATKNSESATQNYNEALAKENELQSEYNSLMAEYASDGTNDTLRQQLYDLQDQLIMAGETTAGFKDHMIENNQTLADATAALEGYNSTIANYEGASAAIISEDQAKISESLALLTNDFQTAETSTRESLERQCETYKTKLVEAREAVKQGAPGVTDEYVAELVRLELKSRQELAKIPENTANSLTDVAQGIKGKTVEMESAGANFSEGLASGILSGVGQIRDVVKTLAESGVGAAEDALKINSPSKVTYDIGTYFDEGLAGGIADGIQKVTEEVSKISTEMRPIMEGLTTLAETWSGDMMKGFVAGIKSKTSEIAEACRSVAGMVSDYLHFTRPEKGPLRYYEEWMPHMMQGLEEGIRGNMWRVTDQMAALAGSMDVMTMDMSGGGEQNGSVTQQVISLLETYLPDIASQKYVMMDGKALVGKTAGQMDRKLGQVQALKERIG